MKLKNPVRDMRTIKLLLTRAESEAAAAGESQAGAEHLLLAALELPDGSARRAFERVGADPDGVRDAIAAQHADALRAIGIEPIAEDALDAATPPPASQKGVLRTSSSAQSAFKAAVEISKDGKPSHLYGAHVVAAIAEMEHGTAARTLRAMGVDRGALAAAARAEAAAQPQSGPP